MSVAAEKKFDLKEKLQADLAAKLSSLNGSSNTTINLIKKKAYEDFIRLDFPTKKVEEWKYTNTLPIKRTEFSFMSESSLPEGILNNTQSYENFNIIVFYNGLYQPAFSSISSKGKKLFIGRFADALNEMPHIAGEYFGSIASTENEFFTAMNTSMCEDGLFIYSPPGCAIKEPVYLLNIINSEDFNIQANTRNLIIAEESASLTVLEETYAFGGKSFNNIVTEIILKPNSSVEHYKIQNDGSNSYQINRTAVKQESDSRYNSVTVSWGGEIIRNTLTSILAGQNVETHFNGLYLAKEKQHIDNHTLADHAMPHSFSNELYRGIIDDSAAGVFNGRIMVRPDAQKTNAYQSNGNIVLTDTARIYAKPQLEIFADDVKCSHGATTGQLDKDAMFYLRSRGLSKAEAQKTLLYAFAIDVIDTIQNEDIKQSLAKRLSEKL